MGVRISAVICTLNRAGYLRRAIDSLIEQTLAKEQYEILIVDNGSTDRTKQVVREEFASATNLRYVFEPRLGLSWARNTGWQQAQGEYVAYLDDDAIAAPRWLETILDVFETFDPKPGCLGGRVVPIWESPRPAWFSSAMLPYFSILNLGNEPRTLTDDQYLAGANLAIRRSLLEAVCGFQSDLGRRGSKLLSNEELLLRQQIEARGHPSVYHPRIVVWHRIPANRLTKSWFARRRYWQGVSDALLRVHQESPSLTQRIRLGLASARTPLLSARTWRALLVRTDDPKQFAENCLALEQIGYALGLLGLAR